MMQDPNSGKDWYVAAVRRSESSYAGMLWWVARSKKAIVDVKHGTGRNGVSIDVDDVDIYMLMVYH